MLNLKTTRSRVNLQEGRTDWFRIENKASSDVAEVYIYDEIGYFGVTSEDFIREIQNLTQSKIDLHINTPGGEVFEGIAIYNAIKNLQAEVTVYVDALAASAGSFIAMAGDKVIMEKTATMMIHDGMSIAIGNESDLRDLANRLSEMSNTIAGIYADKAGGSVEDWRAKMKTETWFNAQEALDAGLADEIRGQDNKAKNTFDLSIYAYAGRDKAPAPVVQNKQSDEFDLAAFRAALKEVS